MKYAALVAAGAFALSACGGDTTPAQETQTENGTEVTATGGPVTVDCPPAGGTDERVTEFQGAPPMCIDPEKTYTATVTTDAGEFTVDLLADQAPATVNNFVFLARHHYYDGIIFHRVIPGFMNQTGDPQGDGTGGPGYTFDDELPEAGAYEVGSVAMANRGPNTNGSQFFIVTGDAGVNLPPDYALFGQVTEGMETVHAIEAGGSDSGAPEQTHTIEKVTIDES
ncbi:MAG: peptidylprolyl isomerase [Mobilicoccus sp.]|nr:peptidylprolyl isomerase [Mobilicoccus sp.]